MLPVTVLAVAVAAAPHASGGVQIPRLDRTSGLFAFLEHAGEHSVLLRPSNWLSDFHPLVLVDPRDPDSLRAAGIDPAGPVSTRLYDAGRVTCVHLIDRSKFEKAARERLAVLGAMGKSKGYVSAEVEGTPIAGYAIHGSDACATQSASNATSLLKESMRLAAKPPPLPGTSGLPGSAFVATSFATLAIDGRADSVDIEGRTLHGGVPLLRGAGESPYASFPLDGVFTARARMDPTSAAQLAERVAQQLEAVCHRCDGEALSTLARSLAHAMNGQVLVRIDRVQVGASLKTPAARFFAVKHAYLAELAHPDEAKQALAALAKWSNARETEGGYAVEMDGGTVWIGTAGHHLYAANDSEALATVLGPLKTAAPGRLSHGAEWSVSPRLLAKAFGQISLLDLMSSRDLAPVFAAGTELGPLLAHSDRVSGWVDSVPGQLHRFSLTWTLEKRSADAAH